MKRKEQLTIAKNILLETIEKERPAAIVKAVTRPDEEIAVTTLENIDKSDIVSMNTTIIIGNARTYANDLYMITRRGYGNKYDLGKE